jgi:hypothetical protein
VLLTWTIKVLQLFGCMMQVHLPTLHLLESEEVVCMCIKVRATRNACWCVDTCW